MEPAKAGIVVGERKAVAGCRSRAGNAAACFEALIGEPEKTAFREPRSEAHGVPACDVQSRACRRWTWLEIGSLGTISFLWQLEAGTFTAERRRKRGEKLTANRLRR